MQCYEQAAIHISQSDVSAAKIIQLKYKATLEYVIQLNRKMYIFGIIRNR